MKQKINLIMLICIFVSGLSAQNKNRLRYLNYAFPSDSLRGFDEMVANQRALQGGFFGKEYKVIMYKMKRDYINSKYAISAPTPYFISSAKGNNPNILSAPCVNEDFEASASSTSTVVGTGSVGNTLAGWTVTEGQNAGLNASCTMIGCCSTSGTGNAWVRSTPWTDPNAGVLGVIGASPLGGTKILQMNDNIPVQGEMVRISQTFPVTSTNALFRMAYLASLNGAAHACCDQPFLKIQVLNCTNVPLACPSLSVTPPGSSCVSSVPTGWATNGSGVSYTTSWRQFSIDLTPYLGSCVTIEVTVSDCDGWAHHGMCYVDFLCSPMTINVNNILFPAGPPVVAVTACGVATATMTAPPGLNPYSWQGPAGSGITSNTNQVISTTMAGNYTLTMNPPGICAPITKTLSLTFGAFPAGGFTRGNTCTTYTFTNTGAAAPAVQTYSFVGAGAPPSYTTTSPTSVVNLAPSTTYTVYQTVTNAAGCPTTNSVVFTTPAGPNPGFTAAPSFTQCFGNNFTFNATTAAGTHTYTFLSTVGAPPTGGVANYGPVGFTAPGTYTVTHTINNGAGCVSATSSVVTVIQTPTATAATGTAPGCAGGTATITGAGGPGSITWTGPNSYTAAGGNHNINNFQPVSQGIYTLTVNNNGCLATRTINLQMPGQPTVNVTNTGPYCQGATIQLNGTAAAGGASVTMTQFWSSWCCWSTCCTGLTQTVSPPATTASSGNYFFWVQLSNGCTAQAQTSVTVNPCTLPVEVVSFDANCYYRDIALEWSTASEKNNAYFTVKRSEDGVEYITLGQQPGFGTSAEPHNYSFLDSRVEPRKIYYYQLWQTDKDKSEHMVYKVIQSSCSEKDKEITVQPIPAQDELTLYSARDMNGVEIELVNTLGQKVKTLNGINLSKNNAYQLSVRELPAGTYQLTISGNGILVQKKVVINK